MVSKKVKPTKEELCHLILDLNLHNEEIAKQYNLSVVTIKRLRKEYQIKRNKESINTLRKLTCKNKYGYEYIAQIPEIKEKQRNTILEKYGVSNVMYNLEIKKKASTNNKNAVINKYGVNNVFQLEVVKEKSKETCIKNFGVENSSQSEIIQQKIQNTKRKNHTFNTSKHEKEIYKLLLQKFPNTKYQYKSIDYPFNCDFYIPEKDLYIEYQEHWTHGKHPFDSNNIKDLDILEKWKSLGTHKEQYKHAVEVWSKRDVYKRNIAKNNGIMILEFFTFTDFLAWYNAL